MSFLDDVFFYAIIVGAVYMLWKLRFEKIWNERVAKESKPTTEPKQVIDAQYKDSK